MEPTNAAPPVTANSSTYLPPGRGGTVLTMGILSIVTASMCGLGLVFGIIGVRMSKADLLAMSNGRMNAEDKGLTTAGRICSIVGLCLSGVVAAVWVVYLLIIFAAFVLAMIAVGA